MARYPFSAIVGADDMALALILTTVSPQVGGVLVRGEKGTAKSTMVRALAEVLPAQQVVTGCRFACDPDAPDPDCPDGPHSTTPARSARPARLVELPVGATEDRVTGSLDLGAALGRGETAFEPGLLAEAHRGILYVDEVNLLHDHLVDLLLDAAAMGRNTVERDGVSVSHAAQTVLVGTMNPEEGELRPQLLDRFGLTVEVAASREPSERAEVVRRRLAFDSDPDGFTRSYAAAQAELTAHLAAARARLGSVVLSDAAVERIATVCAGFEVDGMRADIVTARAAVAHAAWCARDTVTREDIRAAARLALPHRRRRNPFDAPGLDEDLLDRLLGDDEPEPDPPVPEDDDGGPEGTDREDGEQGASDPGRQEQELDPSHSTGPDDQPGSDSDPDSDSDSDSDEAHLDGASLPAPAGVAGAQTPYRARHLVVRGTGAGEAGRRSRAITSWGRTVGTEQLTATARRLHLLATITVAAPRQPARGRVAGEPLALRQDDLRAAVTQGREANLVLFAVDASGSMAARQRMSEVKTAALSLLLDAYQRRDRVGLVTFRGTGADLALPPTSSVEAAARCLEDLPHGGRTPLAEGLLLAARTLEIERLRDPRRRALLVVVTDGRATAGRDALSRAQRVADVWPRVHAPGRGSRVDAVVVDCESGRFRMGLAGDLARRMGATHLPVGEVAAGTIVDLVHAHRAAHPAALHPSSPHPTGPHPSREVA